MTIEQKDTTTPLMRQYLQIKAELPAALVLFQVGDFYELFYDDARTASAILNIVLTSRGMHHGEPIPLCGIPLHAVDNYVNRLLLAGHTVAIVDQQEAAVPGKIVNRAVSQLLTPATIIADHLLPNRKSRHIAAIAADTEQIATALFEPLTGTILVTIDQIVPDLVTNCSNYIAAREPDELVVSASLAALLPSKQGKPAYRLLQQQPDMSQEATAWLTTLRAVGLHTMHPLLATALRLLYAQLARYHGAMLRAVAAVIYQESEQYMRIDATTVRNLAIIADDDEPDLMQCMDATVTAMGSRALRQLLLQPLVTKEIIEQRLDAVAWLQWHVIVRAQLQSILTEIGDIERPIGRLALLRPTAQDLRRLVPALRVADEVAQLCAQAPIIMQVEQACAHIAAIAAVIAQAIPASGAAEEFIALGYSQELDRYRSLMADVGTQLAAFEAAEQRATGINSLKVRYTGAHGYAIEITNTHKHLVPAHYQRQQTLVGRERYVTAALLQLQHDSMQAHERAKELEQQLWRSFIMQLQEHLPALRRYARALAHLDCWYSLATVAADRGYVRPCFGEDRTITIAQGKHPLVASILGQAFIPNDTVMHPASRVHIVTGPNMGGKSTYLRQVALLCYLAQCGSFVPAAAATLPLVDRLFTRIGAGDNLAAGKSTFLVEMEETATICRHSTARSLVILDEVGRGTSTMDGVAIAQAVVEYIADSIGCLSLFATHYHELTALATPGRAIAVFHGTCQQLDGKLLFLHTIQPGVSHQSFGLAVAQLAGMPEAILLRARALQGEGAVYEQLQIVGKPRTAGQGAQAVVQ